MRAQKYSKAVFNQRTNSFRLSRVNGCFVLKGPLKVCFQPTRRCNQHCVYCSESGFVKELSLPKIKLLFKNLRSANVKFLSITGGEPLVRKDIKKIISLAKRQGFKISLDSNALLIDSKMASFLKRKVCLVNTSLDGGPEKHNMLRGDYEKVIAGIKRLAAKKVPVIVSMVLLGNCLEDAKAVVKNCDSLGVRLVKLLAPIPRGRLSGLRMKRESLRLSKLWKSICSFKKSEGIRVPITLSDWKAIGKGSLIIIRPDGNAFGSPAFGEKDCLVPFGNVLEEPVEGLWANYKFKQSHIRKYSQKTVKFRK